MGNEVQILVEPVPQAQYMILGWRQWADAGAVSSGLPVYLIEKYQGKLVAQINPHGYYLFQIPGTHDLIRPVIHFHNGFPQSLEVPENHFFLINRGTTSILVFIGDEPHLNVEEYVQAILKVAKLFGVQKMIGLGGVYGEFPYDKERDISGSYSLQEMHQEVEDLSLRLTNYHGGVSIGSYLCKRAGDEHIPYIGMYAMVPYYDLSPLLNIEQTLRIENDYMAWLGILRRVNYLFKTDFDVLDLAQKSRKLIREVSQEIQELSGQMPEAGIQAYFENLSKNFRENPFIPLEDVWEEHLRKILKKMEDEGEEG